MAAVVLIGEGKPVQVALTRLQALRWPVSGQDSDLKWKAKLPLADGARS